MSDHIAILFNGIAIIVLAALQIRHMWWHRRHEATVKEPASGIIPPTERTTK